MIYRKLQQQILFKAAIQLKNISWEQSSHSTAPSEWVGLWAEEETESSVSIVTYSPFCGPKASKEGRPHDHMTGCNEE